MSISIQNAWRIISQLYSPTNDGQPDENSIFNCGETSVAMDERYLYGDGPTLVSPDTIHDRIMKQGVIGYSYLAQLSAYLTAQKIPNHYWLDHGIGNVDDRRAFRDALALGHPNIALYFWDVSNLSGGHFAPIVGDDDQGTTTRANPWTAAFEINDADWWSRAYQGCGLIIDTDPATFQRSIGIAAPDPAPTTPAPTHPAGPPRYRLLTDGALHAKPDTSSPVTCRVKAGWEVVAPAGDSAPYVAVKCLNGEHGWARRDRLQRL